MWRTLLCSTALLLSACNIASVPSTGAFRGLQTNLMIGAAGSQRYDGFHDAQLDMTCAAIDDHHERCYPTFAAVFETAPNLNLFADNKCEVYYADVAPEYAFARSKSTGTVWTVSNTPSEHAYTVDEDGACVLDPEPKLSAPLAHPAFLYKINPKSLIRARVMLLR